MFYQCEPGLKSETEGKGNTTSGESNTLLDERVRVQSVIWPDNPKKQENDHTPGYKENALFHKIIQRQRVDSQ